ncbi:hypothetical protein BDV25DRAFT_46515 [Aspergillus avenaceus]|uniref:YCII-related domain-containing protein n=1 Tax=Aspergillus avenaceus TaxID=36643 RepID=A0A5N6TJZ5_ASPAV|nr:hypothetical protein BDV25DRAFT_46515 [Aspergillus avenaceus]
MNVCIGGMLESHPEAGQTPPFKGSVIVVRAESENAAREVLKGDVYARSGVWDLNAVQIIPFMCAVRVGDRPLP